MTSVIDPNLLIDDLEELPFEFDDYEDEVKFKEQLREWHELYGSIYTIEVNEISFFFRALTRGEMKVAMDTYSDDYDRTEYVCRQCIIEPVVEDYTLEIYAGVPEILGRAILEESGFTNAEKVKVMIAKWEHKMQDVENQLPLIIKEAFPDIPLSEIEAWPMARIAEYYVKAKWLMENLRNMKLVSGDEVN